MPLNEQKPKDNSGVSPLREWGGSGFSWLKRNFQFVSFFWVGRLTCWSHTLTFSCRFLLAFLRNVISPFGIYEGLFQAGLCVFFSSLKSLRLYLFCFGILYFFGFLKGQNLLEFYSALFFSCNIICLINNS